MKGNNFVSVFLVFTFTLALFSCSSTKNGLSPQQKADLAVAIADKNFSIELSTMEPRVTVAVQQVSNQLYRNTGNTANRIDIQRNGNTFIVKGDSVSINLPYVGERQMGGGYNGRDSGIVIKNTVRNYKSSFNEKKQETEIDMSVLEGVESYDISLKIAKDGFTRIYLISSQRTGIDYTGTAVAKVEE